MHEDCEIRVKSFSASVQLKLWQLYFMDIKNLNTGEDQIQIFIMLVQATYNGCYVDAKISNAMFAYVRTMTR